MKPSSKITCEKADAVLKNSGAKLPKKFEVNMVARSEDTYIARWVDQDAIERNAQSVSDPDDPDTAKAAYAALATTGFTVFWFNHDEEGKETVAAETLKAKDARRTLTLNSEKLTAVDAKS